jgi:hypothetical protein
MRSRWGVAYVLSLLLYLTCTGVSIRQSRQTSAEVAALYPGIQANQAQVFAAIKAANDFRQLHLDDAKLTVVQPPMNSPDPQVNRVNFNAYLTAVNLHNSKAAAIAQQQSAMSIEINRLNMKQNALLGQMLAVSSAHRWLSFLSPVSMIPFLACVYFRFWHIRRQRQRRKNNQCICCGYSLTGNVSGTCPECGKSAVMAVA